jgi:hypothetical protein
MPSDAALRFNRIFHDFSSILAQVVDGISDQTRVVLYVGVYGLLNHCMGQHKFPNVVGYN